MSKPPQLSREIRVSLGTAITIGLTEGKMDTAPTTAYLMTYHTGKCNANCSFCPQARESKTGTDHLSRITWPTYPTTQVISALATAFEQKKIRRVCIQALNYQKVFDDLTALVAEIKKSASAAVSVSCQPQNSQNIQRLKAAGVDRIGIALDTATETVFDRVKGKGAGGGYCWENQFRLFSEALSVFGAGNVSTHVIVGLGETEQEAAAIIQRCTDLGVLPALFAFTPIKGTAFGDKSPPELESYRRIQLARYIIVNKKASIADFSFDDSEKIVSYGLPSIQLQKIVETGIPFQTSGCPHCNRPYYNERPSGPIYNHPKPLNKQEIEKIKKNLSEKT